MTTKYTKEVLQEAANNSTSVMGVLRYLDRPQAGGNHTHIKNMLKRNNVDTSHFTGQGQRGKTSPFRQSPDQILILRPKGSKRERAPRLRRALLESGVEMKCKCGLTDTWQGAKIVLEIDHVNGDWLDNRIENLRFLCPNCHSQEPTSRSWKNTPSNNKQ